MVSLLSRSQGLRGLEVECSVKTELLEETGMGDHVRESSGEVSATRCVVSPSSHFECEVFLFCLIPASWFKKNMHLVPV